MMSIKRTVERRKNKRYKAIEGAIQPKSDQKVKKDLKQLKTGFDGLVQSDNIQDSLK